MRYLTRMLGWFAGTLLSLSPALAVGEEPRLVQLPDLRVVGWAVVDTDPSGGNGDAGLQPGETALLRVYLSNQGNEAAHGVLGQLFEVTDHPDVEILDKVAIWPDLPGTGAPAESAAPHFALRVAATRPCRWEIPLRLELTADGGYSVTREFVLEMVNPQRTDLASGPAWSLIHGAESGDRLASALATGDLDGDGYDDMVLGVDSGDGPPGPIRPSAGEVTVIYGGASRRPDVDLSVAAPGVVTIYGAESGSLGFNVATGDLDGDGFDDLVLSAPDGNGPPGIVRAAAGEVVVIYGGPAQLSTIDLATPPAGVAFIYGAEAADYLGRGIATDDLDGDGFDDLVLGAFQGGGPGNTRPLAGEVRVIYGARARLTSVDMATPPAGSAIIYGANAGDLFGNHIATGDIDGDGASDIVVGATLADGPINTQNQAGEVTVLYGGPARLTTVDMASLPVGVAIIYGADASDALGGSVLTCDLDGDGFDDLVLTATDADGPAETRSGAGEVAVIYGGPARLSNIVLGSAHADVAMIYGADAGDGAAGLAAGDVDGDGFADLVIASIFADGPSNTRSSAGETAVIHGGPTRLSAIDLTSPSPDVALVYGADATDSFGVKAAAGDLDGDGLDDILLSANSDGPGNARPDAGEVAVIPGGPRSRYRHDPAAFAFIDATVGTNLGLTCDDCSATVPIGFQFDFFGRKVSEVTVSSNGYLTFGGPGDRLPAFCPPRSGLPNGLIAALWDDLDPSAGGAVYSILQGTAPNRRLTVEWAGVPLFGGPGGATFEVTLFETSDRIVMQYQDVIFAGGASDGGGTAIIGVENATGVNGAPFSCFAPALSGGDAIAYRRFASPTVIGADDVESGAGDWVATGLWHQERNSLSTCSPASRSGDWSWYYGQSATCNYNTPGSPNSGTLTSGVVPSLGQDARLSFWQRRQTEGVVGFDNSLVQAQGDGGGFVNLAQLLDESNAWRPSEDLLPPDPEVGVFSSLDLSAFTGQDIQVRFAFDTDDAIANTFTGWMVDDVVIHACPVFSGGGGAGAAVEARATAQPPVICEDTGTRLDAVGSYCAACPVALTYQWAEAGTPIGGATGVTYEVGAGHAAGTFEFTVSVGCPGTAICAADSSPADVTVVARPGTVGPTLMVVRAGPDLTFNWTDVGGADDYVVLSGTDPSVPLTTVVGSAASGTAGLTVPLPVGGIVYFKVAGRNPTCGLGAQ